MPHLSRVVLGHGGLRPSRRVRYDPPLWYLANGTIALANCLLAYQAKGAASLAASKVNLANPGTYDATAGVDPTFATATGWQFTGSQWLSTNLAFSSSTYSSMTFAFQFSGYTGTDKTFAARGGYADSHPIWFASAFYSMHNGRQTTPATKASGNIILVGGSAEKVYYDGSDISAVWSAGGTAGSSTHVIGYDGAGGRYMTAYVYAYAIYQTALDATQAAALAAAMAAL